MRKNSFLLLGGLIMLAMIAACSSVPKTPEVVEPPRNPIELAKEAAGNGMDNYEAGSYNEAITAFEQAIVLFEEAAPTAGELDSIAVNIERMKLNIATSRNSQAEESFQDQIFVEAIEHYEQALEIYNALEPVTIHQKSWKQTRSGSTTTLPLRINVPATLKNLSVTMI